MFDSVNSWRTEGEFRVVALWVLQYLAVAICCFCVDSSPLHPGPLCPHTKHITSKTSEGRSATFRFQFFFHFSTSIAPRYLGRYPLEASFSFFFLFFDSFDVFLFFVYFSKKRFFLTFFFQFFPLLFFLLAFLFIFLVFFLPAFLFIFLRFFALGQPQGASRSVATPTNQSFRVCKVTLATWMSQTEKSVVVAPSV